MTTVVIAGVAVVDFVFRVDEMPRRAEKYRAEDAEIVGGGNAANASVGVARLGGEAMLAARLGDDAIADMILAGLAAEQVDCWAVRRHAGRRSSFSSIYVDAAGERQIMNFRDRELPVAADWLAACLPERFDCALADTRWGDGAAELMRLARSRGIPGVIDAEAPVREASAALAEASHVAFSAQGLRDFTAGDTAAQLDRLLAEAWSELRNWICVTDGENGVFWTDGRASGHVSAPPVEAVDTLGAGDLWHGAFALALGEGQGEIDAIAFANAAASLKCARFGGRKGFPTRAEVGAFLRSRA